MLLKLVDLLTWPSTAVTNGETFIATAAAAIEQVLKLPES